MNRYAHIINPVKIGPPSDLVTAQPITFESMRVAKEWVKDKLDVSLFSVCYPEDHAVIPPYFKKLPDLQRSVLDVAKFAGGQRKLPLIKDIMDSLFEHSDAEYLIYTNADIALMPFFYEFVDRKIQEGHDAVVVNRRRVDADFKSVDQLPEIYATIGEPHPGFDCFVIHRNLYKKFILGKICVGIPFIGVSLAHNIFAGAKNFVLEDKVHATIHIGKRIFASYDNDYYRHNYKEFKKIRKQLMPQFSINKFPYAGLSFFQRMLKWGMNPSLSIGLFADLESKKMKDKFGEVFDKIRFRFLAK